MRYRERQKANREQQIEEKLAKAEKAERGPWLKRVALIAAAAVLLFLVGGGGYYFLFQREARLNAIDTWEEYAKDTSSASLKYKGRFVQLSGKVIVQTNGNTKALVFEAPQSAKWRIEFSLRTADMEKIKPGQEVTVRCRLNPRKEETANLKLSNCSLLEAH